MIYEQILHVFGILADSFEILEEILIKFCPSRDEVVQLKNWFTSTAQKVNIIFNEIFDNFQNLGKFLM